MQFARGLTVPLVAAAVLAGCGGDDAETTPGGGDPAGDEAAVEQVWADFYAAAEEGDGAAACAELSDELAAPGEMELQLALSAEEPSPCEETMASSAAATSLRTNAGEELEEITVDGEIASGAVGAAKPTFAVEDGQWKLTSLSGVPPTSDPSSDQG